MSGRRWWLGVAVMVSVGATGSLAQAQLPAPPRVPVPPPPVQTPPLPPPPALPPVPSPPALPVPTPPVTGGGTGATPVSTPSVSTPVATVPSVRTPSVSAPSVGGSGGGSGSGTAAAGAAAGAATSGGSATGATPSTGAAASTGAPRAAAAGTAAGRSTARRRASRAHDRAAAGRVRKRDRALRRAVLRFQGCLGQVPRSERRVLALRAGVGIGHTRSRAAVARITHLRKARVTTLERRGLRRLGVLGRAGACAVVPGASVALAAPAATTATTAPPAAGPPAARGQVLAERRSGAGKRTQPKSEDEGGELSLSRPPAAGGAGYFNLTLVIVPLALIAFLVIVGRENPPSWLGAARAAASRSSSLMIPSLRREYAISRGARAAARRLTSP